MSLTILSPPATEPISLSDAKAHLRVTHSAEDALITALITAARERIEADLGLAMITATFRDEGVATEAGLALSRGPSVTLSAVSREDGAGGWMALSTSAYRLCDDTAPAKLFTPGLMAIPVVRLRVAYQAGYGADAEDVPAGLRQAVLALLSAAYSDRETVESKAPSIGAAEPWLAPFRRPRL